MVWAFTGATFKKFPDLESAQDAWVAGPTKLPGWRVPKPRPPILTAPGQDGASGVNHTRSDRLPPEVSLARAGPPTVPAPARAALANPDAWRDGSAAADDDEYDDDFDDDNDDNDNDNDNDTDGLAFPVLESV